MGLMAALATSAGCGDDSSIRPFDGGGGGDGGRVDGGGGCPTGQMSCGGGCVNTQTDLANCGTCGNACAITETCSSGTCTEMMSCGAGMSDCGDGCIDVLSDDMNCGTCGRECGAGESCMSGSCTMTTCASGQMRCGAACVDTDTDSANCGACDAACDVGEACTGGTCSDACAAPRTVCGSDETATCVDTTSDAANCGSCGMACPTGQVCASSSCGCSAGRTLCSGACIDTDTDDANCGTCAHTCPSGQTCAGGSCACPAPTTLCSGMCTITNVDSMNCGTCGHICSGGTPTCVSGTCMASSCTGAQIPCGGSCVDPRSDNMNCGGCGMVCGTGTTCATSVCRPANDLRANATPVTLTAGEVTVMGTTVNATKDGPASGTECSGCDSSGNVWYRVTLAQSGVLYVDTQGSTLDTKLFVTNNSGALLTPGTGEVWCQDDHHACGGVSGWGTFDSRVYGYLAAGTYNISVGGCGTNTFRLHVQFIPSNVAAYFYTEPLSGDDVTESTFLLPTSVTAAATCGGTGSGEDARWFVTCGGQPQTFSLCRSDYTGFILFATRPEYERTSGSAYFDPVLYMRSAQTGMEVICNDDGGGMGGTDCRGYDSSMGNSLVDGIEFGSRINGVVAPRGVNAVFIDSRTGSGMHYRLLHRVHDTP